MVDIYLGTEPKQWLANEVLRYSILRRTKAKVTFHDLNLLDLKEDVKLPTPSFSRWFIPHFQKYEGKALFIESTALVLDDIEKLTTLPLEGKGALARPVDSSGSSGFFTNIMLLDCSRLTEWKPSNWISCCQNNPNLTLQTMYALPGSLSHNLFGFLPKEWNEIDEVPPNTKTLYFKNPTLYPWLSPLHPQRNLFLKELRAAIEDLQIPLQAILFEMQAHRLDTKLLEDMMAV